jgi:DNA-binding beta-propeller fold protein YncE
MFRSFHRALLGAFCLLAAPALHAYDNIELKLTLNTPGAAHPFTPAGVAVDRTGRIWTTDSQAHTVVLFSTAGILVQEIGKRGTGLGEFANPHGIAADSEGLIYVADTDNNRVQVIGPDGKPRLTFGERGEGAGQFKNPDGIAVSPDGVVAIADRGNQRIQLFSKNGIFLHTIQTEAEIEDLAIDVAGRVYAINSKTHQIDQWSPAGQLLHSFSGAEPGRKPFVKPTGIAVNMYGLLYVADRGASQIRELDPQGHNTGLFGRTGTGEGDFRAPEGIAASGDTILVADPGNHRVCQFALTRQTPLAPLTPVPAVRVQVALKNMWPVTADNLALTPEGRLLALSGTTGVITVIDKEGKEVSQINTRQGLALKTPTAIVADPTGNIYVTDAGSNRVVKMDPQGGKLAEFGQKNSMFKGGQGELAHPAGIAYGHQNVFVADTANSRFQAFNDQGLFQFTAGEKGKDQGQLKLPVSVAADNDRVYVADAANHKVVVFNGSGRFLREMGLIGGEALVEPRQVVVDGEGNIYVLDAARGRIVVYDDQGVFVAGFGSLGKAKGFFDKPKSIALADDGRLYVAEDTRVQVLRVVLLPPAPAHLTATPGEGYVELKWDPAKTRYPAKYVLYRALANAAPQRIKETVETTITDDSLTADTTYTYTIVSQSVQGAYSVPSAPVQVAAKSASNAPRLEIVSDHVDDVYASQYKYYTHNPLAHIVLRNNGPAPLEKIKVTFAVQGYMDFPTEVDVPELHFKDQMDVALSATFNNRILDVTETTPIQAQIKVIYYQGGAENSAVRNVPFKLYSRNTIRWDRKERFAAFVTPNDPTILEFTRGVVLPFAQGHAGAPAPEALRTAWAVFEGLGVYGISYAPRPTNPYDRVSLDSSTVDTMQFARETLVRKSGDCSDVVALLASGLESMTVATCALDAPGHLFLMFDTGETNKDELRFPEDLLVSYAGSYWIPLEATAIGSSFTEAWKQGAEEYKRWSQQGKLNVIDIHRAWQTYEPATLAEVKQTLKVPTRQALEEKYLKDWQALVNLRWQTGQAKAKADLAAKPGSGQPWLNLGFLAVEFKKYPEAREYFTKAKADHALEASALNNLGNLAFLQNDLTSAEARYKQAMQSDPADAGIALNLARLYLKQDLPQKASEAFKTAVNLDPSIKERYSDVSALAP